LATHVRAELCTESDMQLIHRGRKNVTFYNSLNFRAPPDYGTHNFTSVSSKGRIVVLVIRCFYTLLLKGGPASCQLSCSLLVTFRHFVNILTQMAILWFHL